MMHEFLDSETKISVFISGKGYFARAVLGMCLKNNYNIVGVCCPIGDKHIGKLATINEIDIIPAGTLTAKNMPKCDLGITAHSFDYIGKKTRYIPTHGWIGYHPSLLPRHRGRSSIEWAVRMRDAITGGTVFWLNAGIDRGDIAYQDWVFVDPKMFNMEPKKAAREIWRNDLQDMGVRLLETALNDINAGRIVREPQDKRFGTWEPNTDVNDIYRPDALMLPEKGQSDDWIK